MRRKTQEMPLPQRSLVLLALVAIAGCGGDVMARPDVEILDSAGVRVVLNGAPRPEGDPRWTLAAEPEMEVGVLEGDPAYQLFQVSGAVTLSDGTTVIANRGTHDLRFYDSTGQHLHSGGGQGEGPGEFEDVQLVDRLEGDSLLAFDFRQGRVSVFDRAGTFARSFRLAEGNLRFPSPAGVVAGGRVVVRQGAVFMAGEAKSGPDRSPMQLFITDRDGALADSLGEFPGSEAFVLAEERMMSVRTLTFGRSFAVAAAGDRMAIGNSDAFSVRVYGPAGTLQHVVRQQREPVPTSEQDFARFFDSQVKDIEDDGQRRMTEAMLSQMPRHPTFPAFASLRIDRAGRLWVEEYRRPGDEQPVWQVFDRDGALLARVETPVGLRILEIGEDHILGVAYDEFDVEYVRRYRLEGV